jgi:hypothetical protein
MTKKPTLCKAITASGKECNLKPGASGYCHIHDPAKIAERKAKQKSAEKERQAVWSKGDRLREVLKIIQSTAKAAGWTSITKSKDTVNWRYATIYVSRSVSFESVTGFFDIWVDDGVKVSVNKTSFYGHGLSSLHEMIMKELSKLPWLESKKKPEKENPNGGIWKLEQLLKRFHDVARQLKRRHNGRETLIITDEYDVQDLLHALLRTIYDDVRPEENSPSYAGASSRIDFLLKKEQIVVEVKMASASLKDKAIGEQLIIDMKRYQTHPDCKTLVCFVYDPEGFIKNPTALEYDLSGNQDNIDVHVFIVPH